MCELQIQVFNNNYVRLSTIAPEHEPPEKTKVSLIVWRNQSDDEQNDHQNADQNRGKDSKTNFTEPENSWPALELDDEAENEGIEVSVLAQQFNMTIYHVQPKLTISGSPHRPFFVCSKSR